MKTQSAVKRMKWFGNLLYRTGWRKNTILILLLSTLFSCSKEVSKPIEISLPNRPRPINVKIKVFPFQWSDAVRWTVSAYPDRVPTDTIRITVKWTSGIYNYTLPMKLQPESSSTAYYTNALVLGNINSVSAVAEKGKYLVTFNYQP